MKNDARAVIFAASLLTGATCAGCAASQSPVPSRQSNPRRVEPSVIDQKVRSIVSEQLGVDEAAVTKTASIAGDLGADSLDAVELVMAVEENFGIEILDEDAEQFKLIQDLLNYLYRRLSGR